MIIGKYLHTLDTKKRLSIPSKWRNIFNDKVIVTTGLDGALYVFSESEWEKIASAINTSSFLDEGSRSISRFIFSNAFDLSIDSHGRILLPPHLVEFANLKEEVILAGNYSRCEIWNKEKYEKIQKEVSSNINEIAQRLNTSIK